MTRNDDGRGRHQSARTPAPSLERPHVVIAVWTVTSLVAALTGYVFHEPEPGLSASVWYFALAVLSGAVVVAARWMSGTNQRTVVVALSVVTTVLAAVHLFFVVERVLSGLTALILVLAVAGTVAAVRWARGTAPR